MLNSKDAVQITKRAAVVDVTPEETAAATAESETASTQTDEASALDAELIVAGSKVFKKCKSCNKVGEGARNGVGPQLNGIFDRVADSNAGFKYSKAMKAEAEAGLIWDEVNLRTFITKPKAMIKRTKMSFSGLKKDTNMDAIIEYLKSISQ